MGRLLQLHPNPEWPAWIRLRRIPPSRQPRPRRTSLQEALHVWNARGMYGPRLTLMAEPTPRPMTPCEQYLTISELGDRLKLSPKTVKNKMASGAFRLGVHYFRRQAWGRVSSGPPWSRGSNNRRNREAKATTIRSRSREVTG